eukprot:ctg_2047.g541
MGVAWSAAPVRHLLGNGDSSVCVSGVSPVVGGGRWGVGVEGGRWWRCPAPWVAAVCPCDRAADITLSSHHGRRAS